MWTLYFCLSVLNDSTIKCDMVLNALSYDCLWIPNLHGVSMRCISKCTWLTSFRRSNGVISTKMLFYGYCQCVELKVEWLSGYICACVKEEPIQFQWVVVICLLVPPSILPMKLWAEEKEMVLDNKCTHEPQWLTVGWRKL